jgi:hypothetical protein
MVGLVISKPMPRAADVLLEHVKKLSFDPARRLDCLILIRSDQMAGTRRLPAQICRRSVALVMSMCIGYRLLQASDPIISFQHRLQDVCIGVGWSQDAGARHADPKALEPKPFMDA